VAFAQRQYAPVDDRGPESSMLVVIISMVVLGGLALMEFTSLTEG
jgi:hypothetical protein